jgi:hypothetical protein
MSFRMLDIPYKLILVFQFEGQISLIRAPFSRKPLVVSSGFFGYCPVGNLFECAENHGLF